MPYTRTTEAMVGLFDRKEKAPDFSKVQSGSSTRPDESAPASAGGGSYTVKSGDTLSKIAQNEYGDAAQWKRIFDANRDKLNDPDLIQPGQQLTIPARGDGAR
jgi:nucleoid-associated protein YgaU